MSSGPRRRELSAEGGPGRPAQARPGPATERAAAAGKASRRRGARASQRRSLDAARPQEGPGGGARARERNMGQPLARRSLEEGIAPLRGDGRRPGRGRGVGGQAGAGIKLVARKAACGSDTLVWGK